MTSTNGQLVFTDVTKSHLQAHVNGHKVTFVLDWWHGQQAVKATIIPSHASTTKGWYWPEHCITVILP